MALNTTRTRRRALVGFIAAGALCLSAQSASASVAVVDTAGSVSGLAGATMMPGTTDSSPTAHMTLVARTVALAASTEPIRAYPCPAGAGVDLSCALAALEDASARGERVVNFSFSLQAAAVPQPFQARFADAVAKARARGVLVVAAAYPGGPTFPADVPLVLSVGAEDREGAPLHPDDNADLYAPGVDLPITDGSGRPYAAFGSSFATGWISGRAAQMLRTDPGLGLDALEQRLVREPSLWPDDPGDEAQEPARPTASTRTTRVGVLAARWTGSRLVLTGRLPKGVRAAVIHRRTAFECRALPCRLRLVGPVAARVPVELTASGRKVTVKVPVARAHRVVSALRVTRLP